MMVGAADFARIFYHTITLANASGTAAFYGSQGHIESVNFSDIGTVAAGDARNLAGVTANAELFCDCPTSTGGAGVDCTDGDCGAYGYPRSYSKTSVQQTFELMLPGRASPTQWRLRSRRTRGCNRRPRGTSMTHSKQSTLPALAGRKNSQRGATLVEFALSFMLFILVLFSMVELGRGMWTYAKLNHAARQTGRYCMVRGSANPANPTELRAVVDRHCNGMELSDITVSTLWNPDDATPNADPALVERGDIVQVRLTYPFKLVTGGWVYRPTAFKWAPQLK